MKSFYESYVDARKARDRGAFALPPSDTSYFVQLAANTKKSVAVPVGATIVVFSSPGDFYAKFGLATDPLAVPSSDISNGSAPELNPATRQLLSGVTHINLISPAENVVQMSFYGD